MSSNFIKVYKKIYSLIISINATISRNEYFKNLLAVILVIGGIARVEVIQLENTKREKVYLQKLENCTKIAAEYDYLAARVYTYEKEIENLKIRQEEKIKELEVYQLHTIMMNKGVIDTALVIEAYKHLWNE